jgi:hypothetical protein
MVEKFFIRGAEIVQSWFTVGGSGKAVFGAFAVTGKPHITLMTISG